MRLISLVIIIFIICNSATIAQDSYQKQWILQAREDEKNKIKRLEDKARLGNYSSDIIEYPSELMTWGKGFSNGLAKITVNGKTGFINTKGQIVIKATLKDAGQFSENLAPFENHNGKWGYIDTQGQIVIKPQFDWAISFHEGLALVQKGELWGYIDKNGIFVIEPKFEHAESFSEGFGVVFYETESDRRGWYFIDKDGNFVFSKPFDAIQYNFNNGLAVVRRRLSNSNSRNTTSEPYIIDKQGNELWKPSLRVTPRFSDGILIGFTWDRDQSYNAFDRTGKKLFEVDFFSISGFSEGLSAAQLGRYDETGYIDTTGQFVIEPRFYIAKAFSEGLAGASERFPMFGYIDKSGNWVIKPQFYWVDEFKNGFALVVPGPAFDEKTGYIDRSGNYIWEPTK